jgi:hypothetical protein
MMKRTFEIFWLSIIANLLVACAASNEYVQPTKTVLQEPLPGMALAYLMRSPYDNVDIDVFIDDKKVVRLDSGRYSLVTLSPGKHTISSVYVGAFVKEKWAGSPFGFEVKADNRYFLNFPAPEKPSGNSTTYAYLGKGKVLPLSLPDAPDMATPRAWVLSTERDAHWFMFYSKLVLPEAGAL